MIWHKDPRILFSESRAHHFYPQPWMSHDEHQNAIARLILYTCAVLYIMRRDGRVFILAALAMASLYVLDQPKSSMAGDDNASDCTLNPSLLDQRPPCTQQASTMGPIYPINDQGVPMQHTGMDRREADREYQIPSYDQGAHMRHLSQPTSSEWEPRGNYFHRSL